ncbi:symporter small accessory protein [Massilibacteroides vaginae]
MFGINDPGIWMAYLLTFACFVFSIGYGIVFWNKDKSKNDQKHQEK